MKNISIIIFLSIFTFFIVSCKKKNNESSVKGYVTFGANYQAISCTSTVTIIIDGKEVGQLTRSTDEITECGESGNVTEELSIGDHSYKVLIRATNGGDCSMTLSGSFTIKENECTKKFINFKDLFI